VLVFAAAGLLDFAGFAAGAGFVSAGAVAAFELEAAGADAFSDFAAAVDLLFLADLVEAASFVAGALASEASPDDFAVLLDFDLAVLDVFEVEVASAVDLESSAPVFVDLGFFVLADFAFASASASASFEAVESSADAFVALDFFVLADFVSGLEPSAEAESPEPSFVDFDFFAAVDLVDPLEDLESVSFAVDVEDFDFEVEVLSEAELSPLSVEFASVAFFFFVVFLAVVLLESLESEA
jgi:hypothetical protein